MSASAAAMSASKSNVRRRTPSPCRCSTPPGQRVAIDARCRELRLQPLDELRPAAWARRCPTTMNSSPPHRPTRSLGPHRRAHGARPVDVDHLVAELVPMSGRWRPSDHRCRRTWRRRRPRCRRGRRHQLGNPFLDAAPVEHAGEGIASWPVPAAGPSAAPSASIPFSRSRSSTAPMSSAAIGRCDPACEVVRHPPAQGDDVADRHRRRQPPTMTGRLKVKGPKASIASRM